MDERWSECACYSTPRVICLSGDWRLGNRHGSGVYIWGERMHQYDGDWADDIPHGEGTAVLGDGSAYTVRAVIVLNSSKTLSECRCLAI